MDASQQLFAIFTVSVVFLLLLDLFVFHRKDHVISIREALLWTAFWILVSLLFNMAIYYNYAGWVQPELTGAAAAEFSRTAGIEFFTAYLIEKSLSVDNLFVFLLIFSRFQLPAQYQHRVLFWGILGAIIMRVIFIFAGIELINRFHWIIYIFGAFLIFTGFKLLKDDEPDVDLEKNPFLRFVRRFVPLTTEYVKGKFFVKYDGVRHATPMFLVLILVESTDLLFAVDSIPAVLGISKDFFIVFSSNIMAILGLRSLYFALAGIMRYFRYLNIGLSIILIFIGGKMIAAELGYKMDTFLALGVVGGILLLAVIASILNPPKGEAVMPTIDTLPLTHESTDADTNADKDAPEN